MTSWWTDIRNGQLPSWPMKFAAVVWVCAAIALSGWACGGAQPIHHYQPNVVSGEVDSQGSSGDLVLAIEDFSAGSAYDEKRIVYRKSDYRFDYYHYHRWASTPGLLVSDALREVYRSTGAFQAVVGGYDSRADVVLSGRVVAFEEVNKSKKEWLGRVVLDLRLRDARTGELLWNDLMRREVPVKNQSPEGLTAALSRGLTDIGVTTADNLVKVGKKATRDTSESANNMFRGSSESEKSDGDS
jgi:ABC-type uncharacterized transport system auxiliary subunit